MSKTKANCVYLFFTSSLLSSQGSIIWGKYNPNKICDPCPLHDQQNGVLNISCINVKNCKVLGKYERGGKEGERTPLAQMLKFESSKAKDCESPTLPYGDGNGNPLQYSCLENPMDGGAW